jgi:hypothetical protein
MPLTQDKKTDYLPNPLIYDRKENYFLIYKTNIEDVIESRPEKVFFAEHISFLRYNKLPIEFSIKGYDIKLSYRLKHIAEAINDSKVLLDLEEDWDDDGANATNFATYKNAIKFLVNYSTHILDEFGLVLKKPFIDITRDGSISIQWDTDTAVFLIIFKKNKNEFAYYYGQEKETNSPFKYRVKINENINNITAEWLKDYLT